MSSTSTQGNTYDLSFKILLIGDSGVGKSSLLVSFISNTVVDLSPTIGITLFTLLFLFIRLFDVGLNLLSQTHWLSKHTWNVLWQSRRRYVLLLICKLMPVCACYHWILITSDPITGFCSWSLAHGCDRFRMFYDSYVFLEWSTEICILIWFGVESCMLLALIIYRHDGDW